MRKHKTLPLLTPKQIYRIRKKLGLTQRNAGYLLGGGEKAFAKYETGVIKPASSMSLLLRVLDKNPALLGLLANWEKQR